MKISKRNVFLLGIIGLILFLISAFIIAIMIFVPKSEFAFPGAEGFGAYVQGGRGGTVYHVTTLEDSDKPGTLRYAISQSGRRTVVFDISGVIELNSPLEINHDFITIAGQSAPDKGICIKNHPLIINADNVIIRYLRFRPGLGLNTSALIAKYRQRILIDHCSFSWSTNQNVILQGNALSTMQWCIISEALNKTDAGFNGAGAKLGGLSSSYHHNLFVSNSRQNPYFDNMLLDKSSIYQLVDFRNNVIVNWQDNSSQGTMHGSLNMVNNYYKSGPATNIPVRSQIIRVLDDSNKVNYTPKTPKLYLYGNFVYNNPLHTNDNWMGVYPNQQYIKEGKNPYLSWRQFFHAPVTLHTANQAFKNVLKYAGASKERDDIDNRLVQSINYNHFDVKGSKGSLSGIIDVPSDGGGYNYPKVKGSKDSDNDGIPDKWEKLHGLDYNNPKDSNYFNLINKDYTNLEVYLNSLVAEITNKQNSRPVPSRDSFWLAMLKMVNFLKG